MTWFCAGAAVAVLILAAPAWAEDVAVPAVAPAPVVIDPAVTARIDSFKKVVRAAGWRDVRAGFERMQVLLEPGNTLFAFRMNPRNYRMRVVEATVPTGQIAKDIQKQTRASLVIDGGYYQIGAGGALVPAGLLVTRGKESRPLDPNPKAGSGILYVRKGQISIGFIKDYKKLGRMDEAVQVGPVLVDPGGINGIHGPGGEHAARTAVCLQDDNAVIALVTTGGMFRYDLGALLSAPEADGGLGCERAINLDGEPSTQAAFIDDDATVTEILPDSMKAAHVVQNFVVFEKKR